MKLLQINFILCNVLLVLMSFLMGIQLRYFEEALCELCRSHCVHANENYMMLTCLSINVLLGCYVFISRFHYCS